MQRVLLVEDNAGDVQLTRIAFEESGLAVALRIARSLAEARVVLADCLGPGRPCPHLILLDLNLGDGSGHELLAELKAEPVLAAIPVVVLTTSDYPQDRARCLDLGCDGYVVKPNSFDEFVEILRGLESLLSQAG